ncbi:MAG: DUF4347 domain-containing protein, partial [Planctomycetales bacterium]|nr:DUF4347 domain-containing protein [Planctomycetales bacterium]
MTTHPTNKKRYARRRRVGSLLDAVSDWCARALAPKAASSQSLDLLLLEDRVFFNAAPIGDVAPDTVDVVNEQVDDVINLIDLAVRDHSVDADVISRIDQALVDRALQDSVSETAWEPEALRDDDQADPDQPVIDELSNGQPSADTSYEIVFVDAGVEDYEAFISDIQQRQSASTRYEVVILKQDESGVARISATLSDRQNIDAIHFVSHGSDSGLRLGSDWLTSDNVDGYAWQIDEWRFALGEDADLLIYGCDLASSDAGRELLNSLAAACDCDVAASTNDTGHAIFGGDWDLEYSTGSIETDVAFSEYMQDNWGHLLNVTIDATSVDTTPKGDTSDTFSHTTSGADRLLLVGISFGNDKETSVLSVTYNGTALQLVGTKDNADTSSARVEIWSLIAPDLGAHNVTVNYSDNKHEGATIGAMSFNGVDQTVALGAFASSQGNSGALSTTIASRSGEIVFGVAAFDSNSDVNFAPGAGQTEQWDAFQERANGTGTTEAGAASVVTSWTTPSTGKWAVGGVSIKEAGTSVILSAVADTYVNSGSSGANYGNSTSLVVDKSGGGLGNQHALLEFDLSSIPVGSTITGATLQLQATANTAAFDLNIYEVTEDWAEGTGNATAGAANWNQRLVGTNWSTAGGTVNSTVVATLNTAAIGQHNWNVTSLVQDWFAGTAANNGLLIASPDTGGETVTYDSREGTVAPQLVVSYVAPTSTLVVDTTSDVVNGDTSSIVALLIDKGADNAISLREAIMAMNNTANGAMPDEIHFNIAGVGVHTISLLSPLPNITEAVILDATTQNGYSGIPLIQVVSPVAAGNGFSLQAGSDGSTIRGFVIGGFSGTGVEILSDNNVVELNYIGTNSNGTLANGNNRGVEIKGAQNNQVLNNLISGNLGEGIWLNQSVAPGSGNIVQGNLIGTLVNGAGDLGNGLNGIRIESAGNTIGGTGVGQGNTISGNDNNGILLTGINASGNVLLGNKIGVSSSGAVGIRNTFSGVVIENGARLNVIGDSTDAAGKNVISGNTQFGVVIRGTGTQGNTLYGNHIGVDLVGASNIGNLLGGVKIESGATNNYIGRLTSSTHNIISGNTGSGVTIRDSGTNGNLVAGNYIGVSANGSGLLSNTDDGVTIFAGAQNNTIGGTTVNARNVISGNGDEGISIYDASTNGNLVQGNYIGVDAAGTSALGNGDKGISIFNGASNNAIGGGATGASNVIASNVGDGIYIANSGTTGTVIEGNLIGTNSIGSNLGNAGAGIRVVNGASSTTIGGVAPGDGNAIAFNSLGGAVVEGSGTVGNKIRGNSIYANNGLGIDLGNDGVSPNDPLDIDSGPNQLQNRPSLTTSVTVGGNTTITGLLSSTVANTFDLDFYSSPTADPSGSGEGQVYLGSASVVTGLAGTATINTTLTGVTLTLGHVVTATATDSSGNTSEFAANITATAPNSPPTLDLDADNSSGATGNNFQTTFTENLGPVLIVDGDATLTDPDSITIDSATIQITNIMDTAAEVLTANTSGTSIIANFNINTGTLSLTGADTVARYQQVLRTVQYNHTSENPTAGVRLVSFAVDDGMDTVQGVTASVTVNAINDPPAITGPTARTTLVDQPLVFLSSNGNLLTISDLDSGTNAIRVTIAATNGSFSLAGTTGLSFTVGDGTLDSTMTFTGVLGNINNALAGSRYVSNGGYIGAASVQLTAFDLGNSGSGGAKNDTHNVAITVASVSDLAAVPEFLVNTLQTSASQATSNEDRGSSRAIATGSDGSYVVVWTDNHGPDAGVKAQRYNRFGEPLGVNFAVNQTTAGHQRWASVDTDNNGNFVVTWVSENQDGTPRSVYARRFAANGTALSSEFRVNTSSSGTQDNSSVAVDANGDFVVVWEGDGAGGYDIYGRRFDSAGMALGNEFQISVTTPDGEPAVAIADDGRFVVVWDDSVGIRARLYEANGNPASAELVVHSESFAGESAVAMDANGNFVVVWRETNAGKDVYYRQFDSLGNPLDVTKQLNTTTANTQTNPSVAVDAAGNFIATWEGRGPGDTDGVFYRRFTAAGVALDAAEVLVNQTTTGTQNQASLAVQNVNNFAVVWSGNGPGDGDGVFVRQFGTANRPPINSVPGMQTVDEDGVLSFHAGLGNALSIVDSDAGANPLSVTLAVSNGVVSLGSLTGLTFVQGDGSADAIQQFQGTLANINSALSNVQYAPNLNFNGSANLTITTDDLGNSGTGGPQVDVDTVAITVNAVNDPPLNALPGAQATNEDTPLVFSIANGNAISVSDLDAGNNMVEVTLAAQQGTLTLSGTSGLMFSSGDGTSDVTTTFRGTLANINAALNGLVYTPTANYFGPASLAVTTNDLGNLGSGGAHSDIDSVTITVTAVNDAPVAMNDASYVISEETMLTIGAASGVLANDTDVDGPALQAVLVSTTANGTLTLSANGSFVYTPATDFFGIDTFTYKANDGSLDSNIATATITVTNVNDAPIARDNGYTVSEDGGQIIGNVITNDSGAGFDTDADGDTLYVLEVNGDRNLVGVPINLASGATLRIDRDGALQYDLNGQFHSLTAGQIANESFTYTIADGWKVRMIQVTGSGIDSTAEAEGILAAATGLGSLSANSETYSVTFFGNTVASEIDYGSGNHDSGINDDFDVNNVFPNGVADGGNDYLVSAISSWTVPAGTYTIALGSDDGGYIRLSGGATFS